MRIDIIHMRDPDSSCDLQVYVDGQQVDFHQWEFDPGAGYDRETIAEIKENQLEGAPEFLKGILEAIWGGGMEETYERWSL